MKERIEIIPVSNGYVLKHDYNKDPTMYHDIQSDAVFNSIEDAAMYIIEFYAEEKIVAQKESIKTEYSFTTGSETRADKED